MGILTFGIGFISLMFLIMLAGWVWGIVEWYKEVIKLKFETIIKTHVTLPQEEMEHFNSLSPFHKRKFIHMVKEEIAGLIQDHVENDYIEISIKLNEQEWSCVSKRNITWRTVNEGCKNPFWWKSAVKESHWGAARTIKRKITGVGAPIIERWLHIQI